MAHLAIGGGGDGTRGLPLSWAALSLRTGPCGHYYARGCLTWGLVHEHHAAAE